MFKSYWINVKTSSAFGVSSGQRGVYTRSLRKSVDDEDTEVQNKGEMIRSTGSIRCTDNSLRIEDRMLQQWTTVIVYIGNNSICICLLTWDYLEICTCVGLEVEEDVHDEGEDGEDEDEEEDDDEEDGEDEEEENHRRYDFRQRKTVVRYQAAQDGTESVQVTDHVKTRTR